MSKGLDRSTIRLRVPLPRRDYRWWYYRIRSIISAQFARSMWARRTYNLAVRLHGEPEKYVRIDTPVARMLVPQNRWGVHVYNLHVTGDGPAEIVGNLTRDQLRDDDFTGATFLIDADARHWGIESIHGGMVERPTPA